MPLSQPPKTKSTIRFTAKLLHKATEPRLLPLPKSAKLSLQGTTSVDGVINTLPFQSTLESTSKGVYALKISKAMRDAIDANQLVMVEITRIGEEPESRVPLELRKALADNSPAKTLWKDITPLARRDWVLWICTPKLAETRRLRIKKACDMLASGKRRVCCFPGINWLMKNYPSATKNHKSATKKGK